MEPCVRVNRVLNDPQIILQLFFSAPVRIAGAGAGAAGAAIFCPEPEPEPEPTQMLRLCIPAKNDELNVIQIKL